MDFGYAYTIANCCGYHLESDINRLLKKAKKDGKHARIKVSEGGYVRILDSAR